MSNTRMGRILNGLGFALLVLALSARGAMPNFYTGLLEGLALAGFLASLPFYRRAAKSGECESSRLWRWKNRLLGRVPH